MVGAVNCGELARIGDGALAARFASWNQERYRQTDRIEAVVFPYGLPNGLGRGVRLGMHGADVQLG